MPFVKFIQDKVLEDRYKGTANEVSFKAGQTYELPEASCARWIRRGAAVSCSPEEFTQLMAKRDAPKPKPVMATVKVVEHMQAAKDAIAQQAAREGAARGVEIAQKVLAAQSATKAPTPAPAPTHAPVPAHAPAPAPAPVSAPAHAPTPVAPAATVHTAPVSAPIPVNVVEIPEDWEALNWPKMKALAARLTTETVNSRPTAEAVIRAEIAKRAGA